MMAFYVSIVPFDPGLYLCITNYLNGHQLAYCLLSYINVLDIEKRPDVFNNHQQMLGTYSPIPNFFFLQEHINSFPLGVPNTYIWTEIIFSPKIISTLPYNVCLDTFAEIGHIYPSFLHWGVLVIIHIYELSFLF